jgi:outer membrane scaffolding protein for murein synthesis (MipA/OmpV family)
MLENMVLAAILALAMTTGSVVTAPSAAQDLTGKNDVSVGVLDWYSNMADPNITHNVSFRVSFDTNGDGIYEDISTSGTYVNETSLANPFEAHTYVHNSNAFIAFKVEVLQMDNVTTRIVNGSGPVHIIPNAENASGSWVYNNINVTGASANDYYIYYEYRVSPTYQPEVMAVQSTGWNGTTNTFDTLTIIWNAIAIGAIVVAAIFVIVYWRGRRRSPPGA